MNGLPQLNATVVVRLPGSGAPLRARVERAEPAAVTITAPSIDGEEVRPAAGTPLTLEWVEPRGLVRVDGVAAPAAAVYADSAVLRVELEAAPKVVQRREHVRLERVVDILVWPSPFDVQPVTGVTLDLSGGGLRASVPVELEESALVRVAILLPDEPPLLTQALVVAEREPGVYALRFEQIAPRERERLISFVFASHRAGAGAVRGAR